MFYNCSSLLYLPDISKWDTSNIINMDYLFYYCSSLVKFPDISNWKTDNLEYMENIFEKCESLIILPDISKWNTSKIKNQKYILPSSSNFRVKSIVLSESKQDSDSNSLQNSSDFLSNEINENKFNNVSYTDNNDYFYNNNPNLNDYYENFYN